MTQHGEIPQRLICAYHVKADIILNRMLLDIFYPPTVNYSRIRSICPFFKIPKLLKEKKKRFCKQDGGFIVFQ